MSNRLRALNERLLPGHLMFGPKHVVLGVNNFCNLRCVMCDVGTGNAKTNFGANLVGAKTRSMPVELFRHIADQVARYYPHAKLAFAFTEPLAWPPLAQAIAYAQTLGLSASVTSNGLLLPRRAAELAEAGCAELAISLDGPEAVHDAIRRHKGSYRRAIEGISAITALPGAPAVSVYCTITDLNVGSLHSCVEGLRGLRLRRVGLIHNNFVTEDLAAVHNRTYGAILAVTPSNVFETDPTRIDIETLSDELSRIAATDYPFEVATQPRLTSADDLRTYYRQPGTFIGRRCNDINRIIMIDADGEAIPAHGRCFRFPVANIRDTSLRDIWNHAELAAARRVLNRAGGLLPACSRCCGGFN